MSLRFSVLWLAMCSNIGLGLWTAKLTELLSALTVRVGFAAGVDGVPENQNGQYCGKGGLNDDQGNAGHSLRSLLNGKLLDKDEDATDGEDTDNLNDNVDNVTRATLVGAAPKQKNQHQTLNDELRNGLLHAVAVCSC